MSPNKAFVAQARLGKRLMLLPQEKNQTISAHIQELITS